MLPVKVDPPKAVAYISKLEESNLRDGPRGYVTAQPNPDVVHRALTWLIPSFQTRVKPWLEATFGIPRMYDKLIRSFRFFEEATEFVQAAGMTRAQAHELVDYTFNRPVGELKQETGGVLTTLAAACIAHDIDMHDCGETELARIWTKVEVIRQKDLNKPMNSPLPQGVSGGVYISAALLDRAIFELSACERAGDYDAMLLVDLRAAMPAMETADHV